jgi:hypothetical protein
MAKAVAGDGDVEGIWGVIRHDRLPQDGAQLAPDDRELQVVLGHGGQDRVETRLIIRSEGSIQWSDRGGAQ